ncbi:MAG: hypothetical protein JW776_09550 [Candidatus Lokiarchaeota archaeon]|nr:hypothetical protein [Candidatus Lokiarchaeota archaeon]
MKQDYQDIIHYLEENHYHIEPVPTYQTANYDFGEECAIAFPIQGLLKYHGMLDSYERIALFPSISLNNDAFYTVTYLKFDPDLIEDIFYLNGKVQSHNNEYERVKFQLNKIRNHAGVQSKAFIISRNFTRTDSAQLSGKGLGTSAAGGAAIARAAFSILYKDKIYANNSRLQSVFSRYLSGSAARSSVGGFALWMSKPDRETWNSYAIRLDTPEYEDFINTISLISIPFSSSFSTSLAHRLAPSSPFYQKWCLSRKEKIFKFLQAFQDRDFKIIGELAEEDSRILHQISNTADFGLTYWNDKTRELMNYADQMKKKGIPVYYTIDTGPSVVFLTQKKYEDQIIQDLHLQFKLSSKIFRGSVAGPSKLIPPNSNLIHLLDDDFEKFSS